MTHIIRLKCTLPYPVIWIVDCLPYLSIQFSSVHLHPTLCNPMHCSTPGFPVHHHLPGLAQTHIHGVSDAIQLSMDFNTPASSVLHYLQSSLRFMSIELVILSNHLILCHPLLLLPSIFPSIRVFSNESALCIKLKLQYFVNIIPFSEYS